MIPLIGFLPDADPATPGVLTACENAIPGDGVLIGAPAAVTVGLTALGAECRGSILSENLAGTRRVIAGTSSAIYELDGSSWTARASGFTLGAEDAWDFCVYGNSVVAANGVTKLYRSTSSTFSELTEAPVAKHVVESTGFVLAANTTTNTDEWLCSAYLDETDWTIDVGTQCTSGRLVSSPGPITALIRFGNDVLAFKNQALYVGAYVGPPEVWRWTQISSEAGCIGAQCCTITPAGVVFVGSDGIYIYDGTTPRPIGGGAVRDWFLSDIDPVYRARAIVSWDRIGQHVRINYPAAGGTGAKTRCLVYHVPSDRWGLAHQTVESVLTYASPSFTYTTGHASIDTYANSPAIGYDSPFWNASNILPAVFNGSHVLCTLSGACASASLTTGDIGDDEGYRLCNNLRARYGVAPTTSICTGYVKDTSGAVLAASVSASMSDGRHNMRQRARWHRFKLDTTGDFTLSGIRPEFVAGGTR